MSWTLILLVAAMNGGPATMILPGFATEKACRDAAQRLVADAESLRLGAAAECIQTQG